MQGTTHVLVTILGLLGETTLAVALVAPAGAHAQLTCDSHIAVAVSPADAAGATVGSTKTVTLTLGAGDVQGGTGVTVSRLLYYLDCQPTDTLIPPCTDDGDVFSYAGDSTISTDCPAGPGGWSSNVPAGGNMPNEIVFTPSAPVDIPANSSAFCTLTFMVVVDSLPPPVGGQGRATPGFAAVGAEAVCDNGLPSASWQAIGILPVTAAAQQMPSESQTTRARPSRRGPGKLVVPPIRWRHAL